CLSSDRGRDAMRLFASFLIVGRLLVNVFTWLEIGLASRIPIPASVRKNARYTASTDRPRGRRERWRKATAGLRINAMTAATTKISSTFPAARARAQSPSSASGSSTSCTHRGTSTRGGCTGAAPEPGAGGWAGGDCGCAAPLAGRLDSSSCCSGEPSAEPPASARCHTPFTFLPPSAEYG